MVLLVHPWCFFQLMLLVYPCCFLFTLGSCCCTTRSTCFRTTRAQPVPTRFTCFRTTRAQPVPTRSTCFRTTRAQPVPTRSTCFRTTRAQPVPTSHSLGSLYDQGSPSLRRHSCSILGCGRSWHSQSIPSSLSLSISSY
jgi:hypothetical protein